MRGEVRQREKHLFWSHFGDWSLGLDGWVEGRTKPQGCVTDILSALSQISGHVGVRGRVLPGEMRLSMVSCGVESNRHEKHSPAPSCKQ